MSMQTTGRKIELLPIDQIMRPIPPVLDYCKIDAMVSTLEGVPKASATCKLEDITAGELPPVDVLCVSDKGKKYYFAFGGCHRFQAYERNGTQQVRCRIVPCTRSMLRIYLGASVDNFFGE
ncbi:DEKNAAC102547 [Brettanomyces naardenensis]|uniref:Sulfiredoxin n=1 Tax=Brettanomyces naardenensis TaxID=13370 RepID=A0A448YLF7_BRENA|nr:DEKNAAC102547 [Brettanomyces naardenensis]